MIRVFKRPVGKGHIEVPLDTDWLDLTGDLLADGGKVPALIGLVGELIAITIEAYDCKDADYRHWRATQIKAGIASGSSVTAAKDTFEASPGFRGHKHALGKLRADLEFLKIFHSALECKASMVRGRIELDRAKANGTGLGLDIRHETAPVDEPARPAPRRQPKRQKAADRTSESASDFRARRRRRNASKEI